MKITELLAEANADGMVQDPKTGVWSKLDNRPTLERYDIDKVLNPRSGNSIAIPICMCWS